MVHLALQDAGQDGTEAEWMAHVSDAEYGASRVAADQRPTTYQSPRGP
jgi:hypothetical protein